MIYCRHRPAPQALADRGRRRARARSCSRAGSSTTRETFLSAPGELGGRAAGSRWRRPTAGSGWPICSRSAGYELHLAHPLRTKAIAAARVKTDAVDARTLAQLLRADLLPEAYIAPRELRDLRDLLRHRVVLTRMRTALKNRVHALIAAPSTASSTTTADLFGPGGRRVPGRARAARRSRAGGWTACSR